MIQSVKCLSPSTHLLERQARHCLLPVTCEMRTHKALGPLTILSSLI